MRVDSGDVPLSLIEAAEQALEVDDPECRELAERLLRVQDVGRQGGNGVLDRAPELGCLAAFSRQARRRSRTRAGEQEETETGNNEPRRRSGSVARRSNQ